MAKDGLRNSGKAKYFERETLMKCLILLVTSLLLSACATPYVTPTEGDTAKLKVPMPGTKVEFTLPFATYVSTDTHIGELDKSGCTDGTMNPVSDDVVAKDGTMLVPANKDLLIGVTHSRHARGSQICSVGAIVQFEKDMNYELYYRVKSGACTLSVNQRTAEGEIVPTRLYEIVASGESKACKVEGDVDRQLFSCFAAVTSHISSFRGGTSCASIPAQTKSRIKCIPNVGCTYE